MSNTNFDSSNRTQRRAAQAIASYNRNNACGRKGECYSYSQEVITLKQVATTIPDCCVKPSVLSSRAFDVTTPDDVTS